MCYTDPNRHASTYGDARNKVRKFRDYYLSISYSNSNIVVKTESLRVDSITINPFKYS